MADKKIITVEVENGVAINKKEKLKKGAKFIILKNSKEEEKDKKEE